VRIGSPAEEILRAAAERSAALVVVGWTGRSALGRLFLGSVTERVARHAVCPVLIARPLHDGLRKLIAGVDGSPGAAQAVSSLQRFPLPDDCEVRLITVLPTVADLTRTSRLLPLPLMGSEDAASFVERLRTDAQERLDLLARLFTAAGKRAVTDIRRGDPALTLLEAAENAGADLIVVGAKGHNALERFLLGSVSEKLMHHANCSVLIVR
jgi:nucleotide-binding universal stress UspA family protein